MHDIYQPIDATNGETKVREAYTQGFKYMAVGRQTTYAWVSSDSHTHTESVFTPVKLKTVPYFLRLYRLSRLRGMPDMCSQMGPPCIEEILLPVCYLKVL